MLFAGLLGSAELCSIESYAKLIRNLTQFYIWLELNFTFYQQGNFIDKEIKALS